MRKELEAIARIERYLKHQLSEADKEAFEKELSQNPELHNEVELQRELQQGIERVVLKQRIKKACKKYMFRKALIQGGIVVAAVVAVTLAIMCFITKRNSQEHKFFFESTVEGGNESGNAFRYLPLQNFTINSSKDTVIETDAGIVFAIPANCFLGSDGKPAEGFIELEIREAMDASSIIRAGLSTMSDSNLLESAGMFYINAKNNEISLTIDPFNTIYAEVPSLQKKRGDMKLFDGKVNEDGVVNWIDPKPIENFLTPVDIHSLNFYPSGYLDSLKSWGYNDKDKGFTDSLYYSFAYLFGESEIRGISSIKEESGEGDVNHVSDSMPDVALSNPFHHEIEGINPAKIKAIWNKRYANTLIATREFETRLQLIHRSCNPELLELYVTQLDRRLSSIDSMAAAQSEGEISRSFLALAQRNDGSVIINSNLLQKLGDYYNLKVKVYTEAAAKTEKEYWEKQRILEQKAINKKWRHGNEDLSRENENLKREYEINLSEACRQLGVKKNIPFKGPVYGITIATTGYKNIDAFVMNSTASRTTLDYTSGDGKKAIIRYLPLSISIKEAQSYDRLYVYLLPDKLNSFMRLTPKGDRFDEKLNELMSYKLICLGYKGENVYFLEIDRLEPKRYDTMELNFIDEKSLTKKLESMGSKGQSIDMIKEIDYWKSEILETKRKKIVDDKSLLAAKVLKVIFPCYHDVHQE